MGMDPRSINRALLERVGLKLDAAGRVKKIIPLEAQVAGYTCLYLRGDPPRATHHRKSIKYVNRPHGGGRVPVLTDDPELAAAWTWYLCRMKPRPGAFALQPPYVLRVDFAFELPSDPQKWPAGAGPGEWFRTAPDLDNLHKTAGDVLAQQGYLTDDREVVLDGGSRKVWADRTNPPGVRIYLRTLSDKLDAGATFFPPPGGLCDGTIWPAPWQIEADVKTHFAAARQQAELARRACRVPRSAPRLLSEVAGEAPCHAAGRCGDEPGTGAPAPAAPQKRSGANGHANGHALPGMNGHSRKRGGRR